VPISEDVVKIKLSNKYVYEMSGTQEQFKDIGYYSPSCQAASPSTRKAQLKRIKENHAQFICRH
jgi:hypothetical protein